MRIVTRRGVTRFTLMFIIPAVALVAGGHYWVKNTRYVSTENAYVKAHHLAISADIDGRAIRVLVRENDHVSTGDLLFELDPERHRIAIAKWEAELNGIRNTLDALRAEYRTAEAELRDAQQETGYYRRVFQRQKKLIERGVASRARYDEAERKLTRARQAARTKEQKIQQVRAKLGGRLDTPAEKHPMFLEVMARKRQAALNLRRTRIEAPADGIVGKVSLQVGEYVREGKAVLPIVQSDENWIEANLKETQLTHVRPGQSARIVIDAYPDQEWTAKVTSISPSTGAELSVLPPQNASGNWVKVVQRVPVRLELQHMHKTLPLRAGMTVSVSIDTERDRSLFRMINTALAAFVGS
ncbi:MAG: HlyD family secretion protein [Pseudomonadota bacterium]|nr:HlyD family secretion protein [Pseudomonadota bacterium]